MSNGSYNLMLDPSMFLTIADDERHLDVMMNRVAALARDGMAMHVPQAFMSFVETNYLSGGEPAEDPTWLNTYAPGHVYPPSWERLYRAMTTRAEFLQTYDPPGRLKEQYKEFVEALVAANADLMPGAPDGEYELSLFGRSILQEWVFLQEQSWIVAETRGAFDLIKTRGLNV